MNRIRRRRWLSFSLQNLLVAIAFCCIAIVWWQRTSEFERRRAAHDHLAQQYADVAWGMQRFGGFVDDANRDAQPLWEQHMYHVNLVGQYQRAARFGFVPAPVEGEPPHEGLLQSPPIIVTP
jgi:hypothetical protein